MKNRIVDIIGLIETAAGLLLIWSALRLLNDSYNLFIIWREVLHIEEFVQAKIYIPVAVAGFICVVGGLIATKKNSWKLLIVGPVCLIIAGIYSANVPYPYMY